MVDLTLSLDDAHNYAKMVLEETGTPELTTDLPTYQYTAYKAAELALKQDVPKLAPYAVGKAMHFLEQWKRLEKDTV